LKPEQEKPAKAGFPLWNQFRLGDRLQSLVRAVTLSWV